MSAEGFCRCGCGQRTSISRHADATRGYEAGRPRPYVRGHNRNVGGAALAERFWEKVSKTSTCWYWTGSLDSTGYGRIQLTSRRRVMVHRLAYELLVGPVPSDLTIDHLCMERSCVNPAHMEIVTRAENTARMWRAKKARVDEAGLVIDSLERDLAGAQS
jgi:hypothetical protein